MNRIGRIVSTIAVLALLFLTTAPLSGQDQPFARFASTPSPHAESLFDGSTLTGWDGAEGFWRVEDCAITGQSTPSNALQENSFLIWKGGELSNFELRLKFRIEAGNSGIQYRSRDLGNYSVGGYQADIDFTQEYMGIIYDEQGRGILCQRGKRVERSQDGSNNEFETSFNNEAFLKAVVPAKWNEYTIRADGNHFTQSINGIVVASLADGDSTGFKSSGILALQLHVGPPMKVQFKDIWLTRLNVASDSTLAAATPAPMATSSACGTDVGSLPCAIQSFPSDCPPRCRLHRPRCGTFRR